MHFSKLVLFCTAFVVYGQGVTCSPLATKLRARNELTEREMYSLVEAHLERRLNELEYPYIARRTNNKRPDDSYSESSDDGKKTREHPPSKDPIKAARNERGAVRNRKKQDEKWPKEEEKKKAELEAAHKELEAKKHAGAA